MASWVFNKTRVSLQKKTGIKLGKSWKLQTKSRHKLDFIGKYKVDKIVAKHDSLVAAYKAKNSFFEILKMTSAADYQWHIQKLLKYVKDHNLSEFYFIETTLINWNTEIFNMYLTIYSNGSIERISRTIK
ncbi:MAG: transposase [Culicoidibacterales bacterium]